MNNKVLAQLLIMSSNPSNPNNSSTSNITKSKKRNANMAKGEPSLVVGRTSNAAKSSGGTGRRGSNAGGGGGIGGNNNSGMNSTTTSTNTTGNSNKKDGASGGGGTVSGSAAVASSTLTAIHASQTNTTASNNNNSNSGGIVSRSYPRGVGLDFRKLTSLTLLSYVDHHGVQVRAEAPHSELAVAVARHFEHMEVDEDVCIGGFLERLEKGGTVINKNGLQVTEYARQTAYFDGTAETPEQRKRKRSKWAVRPREQVAAKVTRTDENGSWILASVQRFYPDTETYDVQDEDDTSKLIRLPWSHVMQLSEGNEGCFQKDKDCMAIFPETTSFYRAKVSKSPVWKLDPQTGNPMVKEIIVKFEDDEDSQGRTPHRRVPSRYVIPIPQDYFFEDPGAAAAASATTSATSAANVVAEAESSTA